jgi:hypothetical protein
MALRGINWSGTAGYVGDSKSISPTVGSFYFDSTGRLMAWNGSSYVEQTAVSILEPHSVLENDVVAKTVRWTQKTKYINWTYRTLLSGIFTETSTSPTHIGDYSFNVQTSPNSIAITVNLCESSGNVSTYTIDYAEAYTLGMVMFLRYFNLVNISLEAFLDRIRIYKFSMSVGPALNPRDIYEFKGTVSTSDALPTIPPSRSYYAIVGKFSLPDSSDVGLPWDTLEYDDGNWRISRSEDPGSRPKLAILTAMGTTVL